LSDPKNKVVATALLITTTAAVRNPIRISFSPATLARREVASTADELSHRE
jgi:hypothetical protein